MFKVTADDGKSAGLSIESQGEWDVRVSFSFDLAWATGKVDGTCNREQISELRAALESVAITREQEVNFINEDGNIELSLKPYPTGKVEIYALAIPDMVSEDRISFSFQGVLTCG